MIECCRGIIDMIECRRGIIDMIECRRGIIATVSVARNCVCTWLKKLYLIFKINYLSLAAVPVPLRNNHPHPILDCIDQFTNEISGQLQKWRMIEVTYTMTASSPQDELIAYIASAISLIFVCR